jgi:hypothetical protein
MCCPFIAQVSYQHQSLVYSWNLENKIEFWMLVWNRQKPSRGSHTCSTLQSTKPSFYCWTFVISSFVIGTEIPWEYFQYVFFPTKPQTTLDKLTELRPAIYNGSYPWTNKFMREAQVWPGGVALTCSVNWVPKALQPLKKHGKENAWAYMSSVRIILLLCVVWTSCPLSTTGPKRTRSLFPR